VSYRNLHLTSHDQEFKEKYKSVIDAVVQLEMHGEVEVTFTTHNGLLVWRRRCYEYQKITGKTFRVEISHGYTLLLRPRKRRPVGDYGVVSIKPADQHRVIGEPHPLPDAEGVVVTEADMELARRILKKVKEEEEEVDPIAILKGGADGSGRSESGGDESDT